ncbi:MAG: isopentenyl phosphate kinase family protein [Candidatus Thermoplasmatota archaeon]|nr:isopentenyl phosphate kinase family protein [Candidatus Thermoplasmatota archaeon]
MMLVKLGGSLITDKARLKTFRADRMRVLAQEIGLSGVEMILVHGAGSFGHILAKEHKLEDGYLNDKQLPGVSHVQRDVKTLNLMVMDALIAEGLKPVSLAPSSIVRLNDGALESIDYKPFKEYVRLDLMPVTFGDVVLDTEKKFAICSGDDLMLWLSREFKPEKAVFATDTDGVYSSYPPAEGEKAIEQLDWDTFKTIEGETARADVTGGIFRKLRLMFDIADMGVETWVINGGVDGRLMKFLMGHGAPGTQISRR